jgi:hypothetical protein
MIALQLIATSIATLAEGISALTTLMTTVIGMLGTLTELLRKLDLSSPDAGATRDTAETIAGTAVDLLETGVRIATDLAAHTKKAAEDVHDTAAGWIPHR